MENLDNWDYYYIPDYKNHDELVVFKRHLQPTNKKKRPAYKEALQILTTIKPELEENDPWLPGPVFSKWLRNRYNIYVGFENTGDDGAALIWLLKKKQ